MCAALIAQGSSEGSKGSDLTGVGDTRGPRRESLTYFIDDEVFNEVDHVSLVTALSQGERPDLRGWRPVPPAPL